MEENEYTPSVLPEWWTAQFEARARSLIQAVEFHKAESRRTHDSTVVATAKKFERYLRTGE